ncbi:molybdenum ABC transporter ATP-binding protein [Haemophilus paracuniculus]|uniref:Molybdenum ABC transporter ATP-binding protein n=1 Tax=Haemophilus paracuniculus TaxID=734 RepID=A0A1T0ART4_9PAST|nr:molybdenum ABC transporter ATP-binding protein ModC [Haemophilus paracuniculus]OOR99212.1 molybdenum ABC transporter ATP-binding protein [Haemophilus paracuniculus]
MLNINLAHRLGELDFQLDLTIPTQGVTAIFGRSGAGKSSLINFVAGLLSPTSGKISLNQRVLFDREQKINLPPEQRHIGYVFQEPRLFPHYRVEKNLKYGIKRYDPDHFSQITQLLGINHLLDRFPESLSGGEKQRVAIGRTLLTKPDILLMDEPLSALDLPRKKELLDYLSELAKQIQIPILYVSHSLDEVVRLADRILLIEQGKVAAFEQTSKVWQSPAFSAWLPHSQKISLLELPICEVNETYQMLGLQLGEQKLWVSPFPRYQLGEKMRITIASREVSLALTPPNQTSIRNVLQGKVVEIEPLADKVDLAMQIAEHRIWATISRWAFDELAIQQGQQIYLQIKTVSL